MLNYQSYELFHVFGLESGSGYLHVLKPLHSSLHLKTCLGGRSLHKSTERTSDSLYVNIINSSTNSLTGPLSSVGAKRIKKHIVKQTISPRGHSSFRRIIAVFHASSPGSNFIRLKSSDLQTKDSVSQSDTRHHAHI